MLETWYEIKHGLLVSSLRSGYCFAPIGAGKCICIGMECLQYLSPDRLNAESFLSQPFLVLVTELIYRHPVFSLLWRVPHSILSGKMPTQ